MKKKSTSHFGLELALVTSSLGRTIFFAAAISVFTVQLSSPIDTDVVVFSKQFTTLYPRRGTVFLGRSKTNPNMAGVLSNF